MFDDFKRSVRAAYEGVLEFLELPPFAPAFKVVNRNKRIRSRALHDALQNPASPLKRLPKPFGTLVYKSLDKLNSAPQARAPLDPAVRARVQRAFAPEVERLSTLLGRDLSHWLE